ncbi:DMT family transporter [Acinetobacter gerneri]|uniref:DMT family transporter n=1 Tax=Acinetobacter gerneri TaxID=202952 RepID=UPI00293690A6|nr:DMT family transporter [Acinetobacter gerneri]MDV2441827.1 DMT family transporter [Acinetobacter gerneri]
MFLKIAIAMIAFAANSVLCRLALAGEQIDPMSFSLIRVLSGVAVLFVLYLLYQKKNHLNQDKIEWSFKNGLFLATYIVAFSLAYLKIDAGVGALLLFGTVQISMIIYGIFHGESINLKRGLGLVIALSGIIFLLLPGANTPNLFYAAIMVLSGLGWAGYSISGKSMQNPLLSTFANFVVATPLILCAFLFFKQDIFLFKKGVILAILSGGLASSGAYVLWYSIVKKIDRITASTVQLSVPCLAIIGGTLFIGELLSLRIIMSTIAVLFGIILVIFSTAAAKPVLSK